LIEAPDNSIKYNFLQKYQLQMVISMQRLQTFQEGNAGSKRKIQAKKRTVNKKNKMLKVC